MKRVCIYCEKVIEEHVPGTDDDQAISHCICKECKPMARLHMRSLVAWDVENKKWIRTWKDC